MVVYSRGHINRVFLVICTSVLARRVNRVIFCSDWHHTVLARHATQQNVVGESKNMKHVNNAKLRPVYASHVSKIGRFRRYPASFLGKTFRYAIRRFSLLIGNFKNTQFIWYTALAISVVRIRIPIFWKSVRSVVVDIIGSIKLSLLLMQN